MVSFKINQEYNELSLGAESEAFDPFELLWLHHY